MKNQCEKIIQYIKDFGGITTLQAFKDLGITRLSGRIYDLKRMGYCLKSETVTGKNRYGEKTHYAKYSLEETA
ncbi:helix-turn-helix domain-containing protein [Christensenella tenuis]|uniref:Helix-turn-helix domain-containing protein n=1 Tax=Christensenella tenuis TaxID=2763033 RepID=A0ABR7EFB6_9FIRM|nr:helix-turn-helix domain-containing protein [Christensenella tenuis]MBC5648475.1 helix-turn-helix domain-containing protein [Christensenella tenuis]